MFLFLNFQRFDVLRKSCVVTVLGGGGGWRKILFSDLKKTMSEMEKTLGLKSFVFSFWTS